MDWNKIFTGILPLLGVIVGGIITYLTQTNTVNKQLEREVEKEKESKNIERLKVYSEILKLDGENLILEFVGGGIVDFNLDIYVDKLRPTLYSKLYLLDPDVTNKVRQMDRIISEGNFYGELEREQSDNLIHLFNKLISDIEKHIKEYNF